MKLLQLLEDLAVSRYNTSKNFNIGKMREFESTRPLDAPAYSKGHVDSKDPHVFNKETYYPFKKEELLELDGYYVFAKLAAEHKDNPCFPRISNLRLVKDPRGFTIPKYTIEKLIPIEEDTDKDVLEGIARLYFKVYGSDENKFATASSNNAVRAFIINNISVAFKHGNFSNIANENLKEALMLLKDLKNRYDYDEEDLKKKYGVGRDFDKILHTDLHLGNIMLRMNGKFPQLVITDPFSNGISITELYAKME